ncbi:MAG: hypothetical protein JJU24_08945, partial [Natronohydrobacter sp.]|nr:hypothetical protein [Natronohydrobacter sp.]
TCPSSIIAALISASRLIGSIPSFGMVFPADERRIFVALCLADCLLIGQSTKTTATEREP